MLESRLREEKRLLALYAEELLDSAPEASFDRLTKLASHILKVPVSLLSFVDKDRQFFKSEVGLAEPWATLRETPLSHSFCQHVVATQQPLIVRDARHDLLLKDNPAITDLDVVAYLGAPVLAPNGEVLGSLCAIDSSPRDWTDDELDILTSLAEFATSEIALRHHLRFRERMNDLLEAEVKTRTREARELAIELTLAEASERARLAQVLHDDLQQHLFTVRYALQDAHVLVGDNAEAVDAIGRAEDRLGAALKASRAATANLSPPVLRGEGLGLALQWLASDMSERYHLTVKVEAPDDLVIPHEAVRTMLFTLVREFLLNVVKHAGTNAAAVTLEEADGHLVIRVSDSGRGFKPIGLDGSGRGSGLGLSGAGKRLKLFGGRLQIDSVENKGTVVAISIPTAALILELSE